jgi:zinc transport system ATP-binding protein
MNKPLITLSDISYGVVQEAIYKSILEKISFSLYKNQITTLIGPNGSGKSTLIKIILGIINPLQGKIQKQNHIKIGYMPQKLKINSYLPISVSDFFDLYGTPDPSILELLKINPLLKHSLHTLSGGEWQRVLFARSLINEPDLLILDEPTQGVDVIGQHDFFDLLMHIKNRLGCGVLMVSHDLHYVLSATDEVLCLNKHICCAGKPDDVKGNKEYHNLFGNPSRLAEIAPYHHHHDHCHESTCEHEEHEI